MTSRVACGGRVASLLKSHATRAPGGRLARAYAKQRSNQDIAGEVDACVDARVRHHGGEGSARYGEPGLVGRDSMTRRRLLAIAALLLTPLAVANAVGYVVDDPQDAFGMMLTLSLALVAAGYGLVRRGIVRIIALVLAGMLVLGVLEVLLDCRVLDRLIIAGMFWLAVAAAAAAFAVHVPLPRARRPRRPVLFLNPQLGGR